MPASEPREDQRNARLFSALFWVGVGLAPLAALLVLVGGGTGVLRAALTLVILSVILIGVSITLRRDSDGLRAEIEETVFDEIDALRADVRADITHAAQATHRAFGEKMQYLLEQIETTRADLESTRTQVEALKHGITPSPGQRHAAPSPGVPQAGPRPGMPPGIVRHTETVQVTTRHTVMDPHDDLPRGTTYGRPVTPPREEPWTEQREPVGRRRSEPAEPWQSHESYDDRWSAHAAPDDDDRRPGLRAGDRWASVRSDDRGREELRMGERRAALHADSSGTELRIEDRWAAVRRDSAMPGPAWRLDDQPGGRDHGHRDDRDRDRRAITGSDREERWSDYQHDYRDYQDDRDYDRRYR